jgi:hypothetical protein
MLLGARSSSERRLLAQLADAVVRGDGDTHDMELALQAPFGPMAPAESADGIHGGLLSPKGASETEAAGTGLLLEPCLLAYVQGALSEQELLDQVAEWLGRRASGPIDGWTTRRT